MNAHAEAARYTALFQAGVVSKESQQAQESTSGQAQGSIDADKAAIQAAKVNLAYTKILSPINGVVGLRQVDPGNIVHASDTNGLLVVTQLQPIAVIFTLPEDHLPDVLKLTRGGHKLSVDAYDRSGTTHLASGSLLTIDNQIDTTTGMVKVKAVFDNKDGALFPNQFVNVRLILQQRQNAIVIPSAALQTGSQGSFVYVVKPGDPPADVQQGDGAAATKAAARRGSSKKGTTTDAGGAGQNQNQPHYYAEAQPVKVDLTEGTQVILSGGVNPGDPIVIDGQEKLRNGSKVILSKAKTAPAGSGAGSSAPGMNPPADAPAAGKNGQRGPQGGKGDQRP